jgi:hypothetical protein
MGGHWEKDFPELEELNDHEHRGNGEGHGEWKKYSIVWRV